MNFATLPEPMEDVILAAMLAFREDPREDKVDLGVGVFKDRSGNTPIMDAVRKASIHLAQTEQTKAYTTLIGDAAFLDTMRQIVLGDAIAKEQVFSAATTGGTQAIRILTELIRETSPNATLWMSTPTWPNHPVIADHVGLKRRDYRYFDTAKREVDFSAMMEDLGDAQEGDIILVHACCHNPTGADLSLEQWEELINLIETRKLTPLIDNAYQGFGDGLEADARPLRQMAARLPVVLIAASCSKNFGIYRDRAGLAMVTVQDISVAKKLNGALTTLNRLAFSFPPDHGARLVTTIYNDPNLMANWKNELEENRLQVVTNRQALAEALRRESNSDRFDFLARHKGMFSRLGATPEQIETLRRDYAIYLVADSRMNIAGLVPERADQLARAIVAVGI